MADGRRGPASRRPGPLADRGGRCPAAAPLPSASPYDRPGFYAEALACDRHRDIVGGRWDETGRLQMAILIREGLCPQHRLLDIGCGALRLGWRAVDYLAPGNYWGTDLSHALMMRGYEREVTAKDRLSPAQLVEDGAFAFPGVPPGIDMAIAFAVFTHLPLDRLALAAGSVRRRFPALSPFLFTVFLAPDRARAGAALRQPDGVVTHPGRAPYHHLADDVTAVCARAGLAARPLADRLPRGQILFRAEPA